MAFLKDYTVAISDEEDNTSTIHLKFENAIHDSGTLKALSMSAIHYKSGFPCRREIRRNDDDLSSLLGDRQILGN
jgi:hypothetical protein